MPKSGLTWKRAFGIRERRAERRAEAMKRFEENQKEN
jgi:hypothetical protein